MGRERVRLVVEMMQRRCIRDFIAVSTWVIFPLVVESKAARKIRWGLDRAIRIKR